MEISNLIFLFSGFIIGVLLGWLLTQVKRNEQIRKTDAAMDKLRLENAFLKRNYDHQQKQLEEQEVAIDQLRSKNADLGLKNADLKSNYYHQQKRLEEQKEELNKLEKKFEDVFKNLANNILERNSEKFTRQNKTQLNELLLPLQQRIFDFERKIAKTHQDNVERYAKLGQQITDHRDLGRRMTEEAENLTKALKGDVRIQGNWGEMILERILENSGLAKGREYFIQETHLSIEGKRLRPDVTIKLPNNKNLVVDAKVSLIAYERYANAEDKRVQGQYLKEYLRSVRTHVKGLSEKNYPDLLPPGETLDYTLMFVPVESAFALVVQHGDELHQAHEKSIIIVSPATLIATLKTVASIWTQEHQNRNAIEIARQGGALYDKFKAFVDDLIEVGKSLDRSKGQYEQAMNKLVNGKDNLVRKTERLKELGAKANKSMDTKLLGRVGM